MQKVELVARTTEIGDVCNGDPESINYDSMLIAGKAAGVCYMPDDYLSEGIQNTEKCIARANGNKKSGHHSTLEHSHLTFIIHTNKIMAMVLNSINMYVTSEKSGRWTKMTGNTEIEMEKYNKWLDIFKNIITGYYKDSKTEKEIEKLAQENARYMLDIFYPTVMEYTISYRELSYFICHLQSLINKMKLYIQLRVENDYKSNFFKRFIESAIELIDAFKEAVFTSDDFIIEDIKGGSIRLMEKLLREEEIIRENISDSYTMLYEASFAELAQAQRHRTIRYSIVGISNTSFYIPAIIRNTPYEIEWQKDLIELVEKGLAPSASLLKICEQGIVEDFVMKCKERLCSRAQLEICEVTENQVKKFYSSNPHALSCNNRQLIYDIVDSDGSVKPRCTFTGYTCHEPCKLGSNGLYRNI